MSKPRASDRLAESVLTSCVRCGKLQAVHPRDTCVGFVGVPGTLLPNPEDVLRLARLRRNARTTPQVSKRSKVRDTMRVYALSKEYGTLDADHDRRSTQEIEQRTTPCPAPNIDR